MALEQVDGQRETAKNLKSGIIDFTAGSLGEIITLMSYF